MNTDIEPLSNSPLQTWFTQDNSQEDLAARLVRQTALPTDGNIERPLTEFKSNHARSQQTSTVVHARSEYDLESMTSDSVPGLTRGNSVASTSSTMNSSIASPIDGGFELESEDGVLTLPARFRPDANLPCPFQILECNETFSDVVEFKVHVFSHFRGYPLPPFAPCFACGRPFFLQPEDDHALAWNKLLNHMVYEHYRVSDEEVRLRPDIAVMRYMWDRNIITDAEFKRVQLEAPEDRVLGSNNRLEGNSQIPEEAPIAPLSAPMPSEVRQHLSQSVGFQNEPYTVFAGRRQERRQVDRLRLITRVRGNL